VLSPDTAWQRLQGWTQDDVHRWLNDNGLHGLRDRLSGLDGELLMEIRRMQRTAPESFYSNMKTELGLDFMSTLRFSRALDKL